MVEEIIRELHLVGKELRVRERGISTMVVCIIMRAMIFMERLLYPYNQGI